MLKATNIALAIAMCTFPISFTAQDARASVGECSGGKCGSPFKSGGGSIKGASGSVLVNNTDVGDTYQYGDDYDSDGTEDASDVCPFVADPAQVDGDGDGVGDACDTCVDKSNANQFDADGDGKGDACDSDADNDGVEADDNCPLLPNKAQADNDKDGKGDACDDDDNDGIVDADDNCPGVANPEQNEITDDKCESDEDKDGVVDAKDNCYETPNSDQEDADNDGLGDACDGDRDGDKIGNARDNCPDVSNPGQKDADRDGLGDKCDSHFCFVVGNDKTKCVDPKKSFHVVGGVENARAGAPSLVHLYANLENHAIRYEYSLVAVPDGSLATIKNPRGAVRLSTPYEYHYAKGAQAMFKPDKPGKYIIRIKAELAHSDIRNSEFPRKASTEVAVEVAGSESEDSTSGGCAIDTASNGRTAATVGLVLFLMVGVRRRRRSTRSR